MQHVDHIFSGHIAGRAFGVGAATQTGDRGIEMPHAHFQSRQRVGQRLPVGIVKVADDRVDMEVRERSLNRRLHSAWRAHTDGVGHAHLLHADIAHQTGHHRHALGRDRTFIRTAHGARNRPAHRHTCCQRSSHHGAEALDALGN